MGIRKNWIVISQSWLAENFCMSLPLVTELSICLHVKCEQQDSVLMALIPHILIQSALPFLSEVMVPFHMYCYRRFCPLCFLLSLWLARWRNDISVETGQIWKCSICSCFSCIYDWWPWWVFIFICISTLSQNLKVIPSLHYISCWCCFFWDFCLTDIPQSMEVSSEL